MQEDSSTRKRESLDERYLVDSMTKLVKTARRAGGLTENNGKWSFKSQEDLRDSNRELDHHWNTHNNAAPIDGEEKHQHCPDGTDLLSYADDLSANKTVFRRPF